MYDTEYLKSLTDIELNELLNKEKTEYSINKVFQQAIKVNLNSCYGMIGNEYSRYYDLRMAEGITMFGQLAIRWVSERVNKELNRRLKTDDYDYIIAGDSVSYNSNIIIDGKYVKIEDVFISVDESFDNKEYYYPHNLSVLSYDENTHTTCYKKVKYVVRHKVNKKMFQTNITNQQGILTTEDHSLITYINTQQQKKTNTSIFKECRPEDITSSLIYLNRIPRNNITSLDLSDIALKFLGFFLADGNIGNRCVELSVGKLDMDEIVDKLLIPLQTEGLISSFTIRSNGHDVRLYGKLISELVNNHIYYNNKKQVPKFLFTENSKSICSFLSGVFSGDGTVYNAPSLCSVTKEHILDIKLLLFYVGVSSTYFKENTENSYNGVKSGTFSYKLTVKGDFSNIGFIQQRKNDKIPALGKRKKMFIKKGYDFSLCTKHSQYEILDYDNYVYDIEVEDTHTFFANDILVHNTDSFYFTLKPLVDKHFPDVSLDDKVKYLDKFAEKYIQPIIHDAYDELKDYMNSYEQKMNMSREVIASKGFWRAKKNYALLIHNSEGVSYDTPKMKIMGLESVRSSTPEICRNAIEKTVKLVLTEDNVALQKYVKEFEKEFKAASIIDVSFPRGVSDINKWDNNGQIDFLSRTPIHVKGSLTYNRLIDNKELKLTPIRNGNKIKFIYLKVPNPAFCNVISYPDYLPDELGLNKYIDYNTQYIKTYYNPIDSICECIGWKATKRASLF